MFTYEIIQKNGEKLMSTKIATIKKYFWNNHTLKHVINICSWIKNYMVYQMNLEVQIF